jgi:DNA-binding NarL/FixJ family response regulator
MNPSLQFTPREYDVIRLLLLGNFRKMIGSSLNITSGTVDNVIKRLYMKNDCHSIEELLIFLLTNGFVVDRKRTKVIYRGREI